MFVVAIACVVMGDTSHLRPKMLFTSCVLIQLLSSSLFVYLFEGVKSFGEGLVICRRIQTFLLLDEVDETVSALTSDDLDEKNGKNGTIEIIANPKPEESSVVMEDVTGKWDEKLDQNTLENITLSVKTGQLVSVIGPVGCGKSSLLMAILKELPISKGEVKVKGRIAYVSQQPWIFSGSVRQNILFGSELDHAKYNMVIKAAALKRDFEIMPQGDATLIGDRGVSLSGGQKARVSLARALYMDADIYLMDDPLSAVDAAVARHIFDRCILRYIKNKARILITHQVQFLPDSDLIYILKEGRISGQGSFSELSQSGIDFSELLHEEEEDESIPSPTIQKSSSVDPITSLISQTDKCGSMMSLGEMSIAEDYEPEAVTQPEKEERAQGTVGISVYVEYFKTGAGLVKFLLLILLNILAQTFYIGSDWWLSHWSNEEEGRFAAKGDYKTYLSQNNISYNTASQAYENSHHYNFTIPEVDSERNISIFAGIIGAVFLFGLGRALLFFKICVDASQKLHNRMFGRILRCPVSFFDTNPVGRVLNRFSKDVGHMDDLLPVCFFDFMQCSLLILGIILVAGVINPYVFIPTIPLGILFVILRRYYLRTSRSVKRLEGTLRSPVFSYLSATLQGLATIRSMRMETKCVQEFDHFQDEHSEAWFLFLATSRWLAVRLDWLCVFFVTSVTLCAVLMADTMNAGLAGLSITYSMTLMGMFQWGVRQSAEVENQMISVERVIEYSRLPEEAELESDKDKKPPPSWPVEGLIEAEHFYLQYSPTSPHVLKDLSFSIRGREKVGIVGRTGAGKSSLITALFRMTEPEGLVMIDGVNIQKIGLHDLREKISIIPQDPFLFTGTLRKNLDPFTEHSDDLIWKSLEEVKLKDQIKDLPLGIATAVSEGGSNFSVGQRQLICLARAILRKNKILLIDEATANVDPTTDELIQATIRTKFHHCTVLTIAHRLHTIMDSDRVMVLDSGKIVEFASPYSLLSQGKGYLHDMAQQTGKAEFDRLKDMAKEAALLGSESLLELKLTPNGHSADTHQVDSTLQDMTGSLNDDPLTSSQDGSQEAMTYDLEDIDVVTGESTELDALLDNEKGTEERSSDDVGNSSSEEGHTLRERQESKDKKGDEYEQKLLQGGSVGEVDEVDDSSRTLTNDDDQIDDEGQKEALLSGETTGSDPSERLSD